MGKHNKEARRAYLKRIALKTRNKLSGNETRKLYRRKITIPSNLHHRRLSIYLQQILQVAVKQQEKISIPRPLHLLFYLFQQTRQVAVDQQKEMAIYFHLLIYRQ